MPFSHEASAKIDAALTLVRDGKVTSFSEAARIAGCSDSGLRAAWRREHPIDKPPFASKTVDVDELTLAAESDEEPEPTPGEVKLAKTAHDLRGQRDAARTEKKLAEQRADDLAKELEATKKLVGLAERAEAAERPEWTMPTTSNDHHGTLVACFSDYHVGEVTNPSEMNWYNAYDPDIAEMRVKNFFNRTITVSRDYLAGVKYDGIILPSLGDGVSGDIHDEYRETNEWSNYEAANALIPWLEEGVERLADEFGRVHILSVPGNHPRDSRKPRYKKRVAHNADTFIWWQVARTFRDDDRVTFDIPDGLIGDFQVYDTKFRIEHGDEAKGGSGIQGAMLPIALMTHRRRKQAQAEGTPFDCLLMGHWHQTMFMTSKGFCVNGCGKGYDEYARGKSFEPEPPQQSLLVVTPEHGITVQTPLFVSKRDEEGW